MWGQMQLTPNFTLEELVASDKAKELKIDNRPTDQIALNLKFTAAGLERIRAFLSDTPIVITSGYRSESLNKAVGGAKNSQHQKGEAVDFICPKMLSPWEVCKALESSVRVLGIDQLIYERMWVHVSFTTNPRYELLTLDLNGEYIPGIMP